MTDAKRLGASFFASAFASNADQKQFFEGLRRALKEAA